MLTTLFHFGAISGPHYSKVLYHIQSYTCTLFQRSVTWPTLITAKLTEGLMKSVFLSISERRFSRWAARVGAKTVCTIVRQYQNRKTAPLARSTSFSNSDAAGGGGRAKRLRTSAVYLVRLECKQIMIIMDHFE